VRKLSSLLILCLLLRKYKNSTEGHMRLLFVFLLVTGLITCGGVVPGVLLTG
jgi:hypothetical protein